jgi:type I restriction enzyme S subunit
MTDGDWVESKDQDLNGDVRLIQLADIGDGIFLNKSIRFLTLEKAEELRCTFLKEGDLLIARMPDPLGRACLFPKLTQKSVTVVDVCVWRAENGGADSKWLMYIINSPDIRSKIQLLASGTTRQRVSGKNLKTLSVAIPPLAEQKRIVTKLDSLFAHTRRARQELDHIPKLIERYKQAILSAACTGRLTVDWREENPNIETAAELLIRIHKEKLQKYEEKSKKSKKIVLSNDKDYVIESWKYTTLENIAEEIVDCPHSTPKWVEDGFICVRTTQFERFKLKMDNLRYVSQETFQERILRLKPQAGDILYSREGGILGIACQIPPNVELCLGQRMMLIRCNDNWLSGEYLTMLLNSEIILSKVKDLITGTASPHLNVGDVKSFEIPLPPVLEQQEIIKRVKNYFQAIDRLEQEYQKAIQLCDRLEQSTLAKAFRGEIVPQDPNDEPASLLLERIQKEQENQKLPKKKQLSLLKPNT